MHLEDVSIPYFLTFRFHSLALGFLSKPLLHFCNINNTLHTIDVQLRHDTRFQKKLRIFKQMNPSSVPHKQIAAMRPVLFFGTSQSFPIYG